MTPDELQAARDWAAEKLGFTIYEGPINERDITDFPCVVKYKGRFCMLESSVHEDKKWWQPDTDLNQCFLLVERMRELGWYLYCEPEPNLTFPGFEKGVIIYEIGFYHPENQKAGIKPDRGYGMFAKITPLSMLIAAMATDK